MDITTRGFGGGGPWLSGLSRDNGVVYLLPEILNLIVKNLHNELTILRVSFLISEPCSINTKTSLRLCRVQIAELGGSHGLF